MTRAYDAVFVGEDLPALHHVVTAREVKAYADASGDDNPLHQDEAFARSVGFDGIIAHGMYTMGLMAACIAGWAGGDPASVLMLSAQFRAPVFMGEEIEAGGRVRSVDPETRTATLETWVSVERDGRTEWPIKRGAATVRLA
jgi:acyl dehydratase